MRASVFVHSKARAVKHDVATCELITLWNTSKYANTRTSLSLLLRWPWRHRHNWSKQATSPPALPGVHTCLKLYTRSGGGTSWTTFLLVTAKITTEFWLQFTILPVKVSLSHSVTEFKLSLREECWEKCLKLREDGEREREDKLVCPEDGGGRFPWTSCNFLLNYTASHPRRL